MVSGKSIESHIFDGGLVKLTRRNHRRASCLAGVCFSQTKLHLGIAATLGGMKTDPSMKETFEASKFKGGTTYIEVLQGSRVDEAERCSATQGSSLTESKVFLADGLVPKLALANGGRWK
jgi:hypothetical protein